ncbi:hypothetical protein Tco_0189669 [Tanacetum coccineum]
MDSSILNNKEWKESDYGNPLYTTTDSFFKAHDEHDIEKGNVLRQMKRKKDDKNDEQPNKSWNKRRMDSSILNNKEWKESDYGNPLYTTTDSFFKAHDEHDIEKGNVLRQMKRKKDDKNDEQPNKRVCKAKKLKL